MRVLAAQSVRTPLELRRVDDEPGVNDILDDDGWALGAVRRLRDEMRLRVGWWFALDGEGSAWGGFEAFEAFEASQGQLEHALCHCAGWV